jgi:NADPH:quinone reductase-like Zn-dependent oxidoreductase
VREITGGAGVPFAVDAVGGLTGGAVARTLAPGGRMLLYGTLAGEPIPLDPRALIAGQKSVEGFWLSDWSARQGVLTMLRLFRQIKRLLRDGVLTSEVGATFGMDEIRAAVERAETPGRQGKVLLRLGPAAG